MLAWLGTVAGEAWLMAGVAGFLLCALWETFTPEHAIERGAAKRWTNHFVLYAIGLGVGIALLPEWVSREPRFAFKAIQGVGGDIAVLVVGILALDLLLYALHWIQHRIFFFWRFHAVHHSDQSVDTSTALRHHPVEFVAVGTFIMIVSAAAGAPLWLFPVFNLLSLLVALFQHVNVALPDRIEGPLQAVLVSPRMHRTHHSDNPAYYSGNFGNVFSFWDRMFGTYHDLPTSEAARLKFGIGDAGESQGSNFLLPWLLPLLLGRPRSHPFLSLGPKPRINDLDPAALEIMDVAGGASRVQDSGDLSIGLRNGFPRLPTI